jgi:hypothetical protein
MLLNRKEKIVFLSIWSIVKYLSTQRPYIRSYEKCFKEEICLNPAGKLR